MHPKNVFPLVFVILMSIGILAWNRYFKSNLVVQLFLFGYIVQLSTIVHELGHVIVASGGDGWFVELIDDATYIPYVGFKNLSSYGYDYSYTYNAEADNVFARGMAGFASQIIYLWTMGLLFFKGNSFAISVISSGFIIYMFTYLYLYRKKGGGDFGAMTDPYH